jgi:SAM-dependent methyltransferase
MDVAQRKNLLVGNTSKTSKILEMGPSYNPLVPKRDGWNTLVVDRASRDSLITHYAALSVDTSRIEDVDFVWAAGDLIEAIPSDHIGSFDLFLASHVIEHSPDVVRFLKAAESLIHPGGLVVLAIPDKRACFDFFRHPSSTAEAVRAWQTRRDRHTHQTFFECDAYTVFKLGHPGWYKTSTESVRLDRPISDAVNTAEQAESSDYIDAHGWVFTPSSFALMVFELRCLGLTNLVIDDLVPSADTEFFVWLKPDLSPMADLSSVNAKRVELLTNVILDLEEQAIQIPLSRQSLLQRDNDQLREENAQLKERLAEHLSRASTLA